MKKIFWALVTSCACSALLLAAQDRDHRQSRQSEDLTSKSEPDILGVHWARDFAPVRLARVRNANMTYHGGKIMPTVVSEAIWWGPTWSTYTGDKIAGMDNWYWGHSGSNYAATVDEYTGSNGRVGSSNFVHNGHTIDPTTAASGSRASPILAEICKEASAGKIQLDPGGDGYYPVYVDVKRGNAGYCAWHAAGSCTVGSTSVPVQFAFFFNLDGDPGCDPQDTSGLHSQGLAALANVSGHEISEARSDPASPGAWYDSSGQENGDKCAWTFNTPLVSFTNGSAWKIQGEWSNAAYSAGTGYPNSSGQRGCLDGR
jgi:hypothetical protein